MRLRKESLHVKIGGKSIAEITSLPIKYTVPHLTKLEFSQRDKVIAEKILKEILSRLEFMLQGGLDFFSLNRT